MSKNMIPTNKLRLLERKVQVHFDDTGHSIPPGFVRNKMAPIPQQWFNDTGLNGGPDVGEWRDIPRERE